MTGWIQCDNCDAYSNNTVDAAGGRRICEDCVRCHQTCDDCLLLAVDTYRIERGDRVCISCLEENYHECDNCFTLIPLDDNSCSDCDHPDHDGVHHYDYKPTARFYGDGPLFLGLELEIKTPRQRFTTAVDTSLDHLGRLGYLKEDSSIRPCGFELVTHPMSYQYARTRFPWPLLNRLRQLGCYTDAEVGIHVHLSRAGFGSPAHAFRWMKFVYRNQAAVTTLARRSSSWAEFTPKARSLSQDFAKGERAGAKRYQAINVLPEETFELRIFASSLHPQQVQAALAFAAASVEYTRHLSAVDIARRRGWEWNAFTTWLRAHLDYTVLLTELEALACAS
ncbi:hypothetical protein [Nocardia sp. NPDC052566]|uniref:hypothetical protein n=1 Tax=Nocardia sp. NPDC052566 TaxID=3364330 RepID=UPI0037C52A77